MIKSNSIKIQLKLKLKLKNKNYNLFMIFNKKNNILKIYDDFKNIFQKNLKSKLINKSVKGCHTLGSALVNSCVFQNFGKDLAYFVLYNVGNICGGDVSS